MFILVLSLGLIASVAKADFTFGRPTDLGPNINTSYGDYDPGVSADGLSLSFGSDRPGGFWPARPIAEAFENHRVFTGDLNILITSWKKAEVELPGDCPRPK